MFELFDEWYDIQDKENAIEFENVKGNVRFDNISFRYRDTGDEVLHNISLDVEQGQTIALVGTSGGGKSSLISLIPRFYDVSAGSVLIDGVNVQDVSLKSLREQIGIVYRIISYSAVQSGKIF